MGNLNGDGDRDGVKIDSPLGYGDGDEDRGIRSAPRSDGETDGEIRRGNPMGNPDGNTADDY